MKLSRTPENAARYLIEEEFTIEQYQEIQDRRKERLAFWKSRDLDALIKTETALIEFGEKVLKLLKEHYGNK